MSDNQMNLTTFDENYTSQGSNYAQSAEGLGEMEGPDVEMSQDDLSQQGSLTDGHHWSNGAEWQQHEEPGEDLQSLSPSIDGVSDDASITLDSTDSARAR